MSQIAISEFYCKSLLYAYLGKEYDGICLNQEDIPLKIDDKLKYVIKPDQKFGGRGKLGLVGVNIDKIGIQSYLKEFRNRQVDIKGNKVILNQFLLEPFIPHNKEYYLAFDTNDRDGDTVYFSDQGGVDVESNRDKVTKVLVTTGTELDVLKICDNQIIQLFISKAYEFFKEYGFSYLEFNPFIVLDSNIILLDAVAKVDSCESFRQKEHWGNYPLLDQHFATDIEKTIADIDIKSGASLKLSLLNPDGAIWLILGGGGASVVTFDTLVEHGFKDEIANYGELSGNPSIEDNYEYSKLLIHGMIHSCAPKKYLLIIGGIANFSNILELMKGVRQAIDENIDAIRSQNIHIIIRRGGILDVEGLAYIKDYLDTQGLAFKLYDGNTYLTQALQSIQL